MVTSPGIAEDRGCHNFANPNIPRSRLGENRAFAPDFNVGKIPHIERLSKLFFSRGYGFTETLSSRSGWNPIRSSAGLISAFAMNNFQGRPDR